MTEDKKKILELIESGKISAKEGMELLEALEESEYESFVDEEMFDRKREEEPKQENEKFKKNEHKHKQGFGKGFDKFSEKFDNWDEKFSGKFSFFGEEVAKKTQVFSEKVLDKLEKILDGNPFENFWESSEKPMKTEIIEVPAESIQNIELHAVNGKIIVSKSDTENIKLEVKYLLKNSNETLVNAPFNYEIENNTLTFNPTMRDDISLNLYASIPQRKFLKIGAYTKNGKIELNDILATVLNCKTKNSGIKIGNSKLENVMLNTKNGKIFVDDTTVENIELTTANSSINLDDLNAQKLIASTQNGAIILTDVICATINAKTTNAQIKLNDCKSVYVDCETSNGKILVSDISSVGLKEITLETSNAGITTKFSSNEKNFYIDTSTNQGIININIPNMEYFNEKENLQGNKRKTGKNYIGDVGADQVITLTAKTSNGSINIQ